jgi:hypothetical protein
MNRQMRRILQALKELRNAVEHDIDEWEKREKTLITPSMRKQIEAYTIPNRYRELVVEWNLNKDEQAQISSSIKKRLGIDLAVNR